MRIAVVGATGLVGSAIARELEARGHGVVAIGRGGGSDVRFDLAGDAELPAGALAGCDALVHAAGVTDEDFADRRRAFAKALEGTEALARAARQAEVRQVAYVSSAHVYGPLEGVIDEARPVDPRSDYAIAHYAAEQIVRRSCAAAPQARALLLRPCAVFGRPPSLESFARWSLIPFDFPRQAVSGRIVLRSPGLQMRNFVAADALARLVADWLSGAGAPGVAVRNAPGPHQHSVYDFARSCADIARETAGIEARIERPAPTGPAPLRLDYRTQAPPTPGGTSLDDHVRGLVRDLARKVHP